MSNLTPLGFALLPDSKTREDIYILADQVTKQFPCSWGLSLDQGEPHISVWQQNTPEQQVETVIETFLQLKLPNIPDEIAFDELSLWATKIVFLDAPKLDALKELQSTVHQNLSKHQAIDSGSADPQVFNKITANEQESYTKTGYPFLGSAFRPHFTLAHLNTPNEAPDISAEFSSLWKRFGPATGSFSELIVFKVLPKGVCKEILCKLPLSFKD